MSLDGVSECGGAQMSEYTEQFQMDETRLSIRFVREYAQRHMLRAQAVWRTISLTNEPTAKFHPCEIAQCVLSPSFTCSGTSTKLISDKS